MKKIHKQTFMDWKAALIFLFALLLLPIQNLRSAEELKPKDSHSVAAPVIAKLLRKYHYNHQKIDDALSSETLDLYIESLDRSRLYFLASDISEFEKFRYTLDDIIFSGDLEPVFQIFNTWKTRAEHRIEFATNRLDKEFDFTIDENFTLDRSEAEWAITSSELDELWRKKLKNEALGLRLADQESSKIKKKLKKRYATRLKNINQYNSEDVFQLFINSLSETFDPHTSYFSPVSSENFNIDMSLSLQGIGAQLTTEDEYTKVVRIITGGPADKSKLILANDKIIGVAQGKDGQMVDVIGWRLDDVVQKIRGKKGSTVRLEIIQAESPAGNPPKEIILVRDKVVIEERAAKSDTVEFDHEGRNYKLGVITIPSFYIDLDAKRKGDRNYKSTTRDVRRLIKELQGAGVDGIVIDLRNNGGGSLQEAIELTGLFIKEGPVVQQKDLRGSKRVEYDPDPEIVYEGPLSVIVNRYSASASEIFAAAIQDYGRGIVLGSQTFGKGTVQNLLSLNRFMRFDDEKVGQLKITVAKFYRITGASTQHRGVIPDINFPSIYNEFNYLGEDKQDHALPWDEISPAMFQSDDRVSMYLSTLSLSSKKRLAKNTEFQYLVEGIDRYKKEKDQNTISLNEATRKTYREEREAVKLKRVNERRAAKGLKPLKKGEKIAREDQAPDTLLEE
ncbi:carboxy terminal-processing peptidase, partial [candidate division KSB1 bacterium]|nr:carboxy terminal-processing peptidase [candidate division KSB1 bacterium]